MTATDGTTARIEVVGGEMEMHALGEYIADLQQEKRRLDLLEEWYQARRFDVSQQRAGLHIRDDNGFWNRPATLREAADAEISRRGEIV
jgi:hypothetical protein